MCEKVNACVVCVSNTKFAEWKTRTRQTLRWTFGPRKEADMQQAMRRATSEQSMQRSMKGNTPKRAGKRKSRLCWKVWENRSPHMEATSGAEQVKVQVGVPVGVQVQGGVQVGVQVGEQVGVQVWVWVTTEAAAVNADSLAPSPFPVQASTVLSLESNCAGARYRRCLLFSERRRPLQS